MKHVPVVSVSTAMKRKPQPGFSTIRYWLDIRSR